MEYIFNSVTNKATQVHTYMAILYYIQYDKYC